MVLERYDYEIGKSYKQYEFYSTGPNGNIRKIIMYRYLGRWEGIDYYNLGFGDYDERVKKVNDLSISDNQDMEKVLATVAFTTLTFFTHFPGCKIIAEGSTPGRTRLYQMGISKHHKTISEIFDIQGLTHNEGWIEFKRGRNYLAFSITEKKK